MKTPNLRPLQIAANEFLATHQKAYLCLRMRLGKSAVALQQAEPGKPTIVVSPVSVLHHWVSEVKLWRPDLTVELLRKGTDKMGDADVTVLPYSILPRLLKEQKLNRPAYVIIDEAHYAKSLKAQRTKAVMFLVKAAPRVACLTGTPIPNRPIELYPILKAMNVPFAPTKQNFGKRYCDAKPSPWHPGLDMTGASNLDELQEKLKDWMFHSQGGYVPPIPTVFEVDAKVSREETALIDSIDWEAEEPKIPFEQLSLVRRLSSEDKFEPGLEHILDCLESMDKVVVFAWHTELINRLRDALKEKGIGCAVITGSSSSKSRLAATTMFDTDPNCRVFLGNIQAAGEGISLAAASHAVFLEQAWTPGAMDQAAARIETADMTRIVSLDYLVRRRGIDAKLIAKIMEKRDIVSQALSEDMEGMEDLI